jgi:hypothetical protein
MRPAAKGRLLRGLEFLLFFQTLNVIMSSGLYNLTQWFTKKGELL